MKIIFYTTDLFKGREHLMPWRTVLEVAEGMLQYGHQVIVLNGVSDNEYLYTYIYNNVEIRGISKNLKLVANIVQKEKADAFFIECKWRDAVKGFSPLRDLTCKKYAYFTGGVYDLKSVKLLYKCSGLSSSRAYWMEVIIPKKLVVYRLKQAMFSGVIGLSDYTTKKVLKSGFPNVKTILPGKDGFETFESDTRIIQRYGLQDRRFLCFTGAPAFTRGAKLFLQAIDKAEVENICAVFLMRTDVGSDFKDFNLAYQQMKYPERVVLINEKLSREQLKAFFENAWYMVLPFIVIPSEIPLTFFEIMSCGTPVITFKNGGTSDYLNDGLFVVDKSIEGLSSGIVKAWKSEKLRLEKAKGAKQLMNGHPTWNDVTKRWMALFEKKDK